MSATAAASPQGKSGSAEPSMEEILASIRRIIADDSLGTKKDEPPPPPAAKAPEPVVEEEDADVLDLAEVATVPGQPVEVDVVVEARPAPALLAPAPSPDDDLIAGIEPAPVVIEAPLPKLAPVPQAIEKPAEPPAPQPPAPAPFHAAATLESRILSEQSGQLVGAAFQALSRNVSVPTGRTLEEIVVEIMRPMLKAWLDDNLPNVVERLVRAEIERVARGG